ncbi:MAG: hypothetical protein ACOYD0_11875 [Candidatus Nanopelagicales bacterium]
MPDIYNPQQNDMLPLSPEDVKKWKSRIEASKEMIDEVKDEWDENVDRYLLKKQRGKNPDDIVVPKDFAFVEAKKSQLMFQTPQVILGPLLPGIEPAVPVFEEVLNYYLGQNGVNAKAAVDEVLTDALCPSGIFAIKIGYESTVDGTKPMQMGEQPDPNFVAPPMLDPMAPPPQPPMVPIIQQVPNIIFERYIFERISPVKLIIPTDFKGSDYDKAAYQGFEFLMDLEVAKRAFDLPADFKKFVTEDDRLIGDAEGDKRDKRKKVRGWEIYYKAAIFDPSVKHPELQRCLVLIEGLDKPAKHRDSPYQQWMPDGTLGGMPGFPVHIGALRYVSDSALPPSDCSMSKPQVDELSQGRTDMKTQRRRNIPMRVAELSGVGGVEGLAKIEKNIYQGIIPLDSINPMPIADVPRASYPQENFEFDKLASRDLEEVWALGANPTGALNPTNRTATELAIAQNQSGNRLSKERNRFISWYVRGVEKLASLIQMFADEPDYVAITGSDGQKRIQQWDKTTIQGKFAFAIRPNSFAPLDATQDRADFLQFYNLLANSPNVDRLQLESELVRKFGLDPQKLIKAPTPPPPPPPESPKVSVSIDEKCLTPSNPAFAIFIEILKDKGVQISDASIQAAQQAAAQISNATGLPVTGAPSAQPPMPPAPEGPGGPGGPPSGLPPGRLQEAAQKATPVDLHQSDITGHRTGPKPGGFARLNEPVK